MPVTAPDAVKLRDDMDLAAAAVAMIPFVGRILEDWPEMYDVTFEPELLQDLIVQTGLGVETVYVPEVHGEIDGCEPGDTIVAYTDLALQIREVFRNVQASKSN